jgi:hypothetical protein
MKYISKELILYKTSLTDTARANPNIKELLFFLCRLVTEQLKAFDWLQSSFSSLPSLFGCG